ncbi:MULTISPECIES: SCO family protein [unclassified Microbulbifer]|uniref:SCO family protein n=1 Tax=unclassified Microbulbifer TaxID=2619833 RepID=UPI0027E3D0BE|nr:MULTISPECIES: SCO family protein [unclassified Microbulbifer]
MNWLTRICSLLLLPVLAAEAQPTAEKTLDAVAFNQRIGAPLPTTAFRNANGEAMTLTALAEQGPLILVLSWFECPHLCPMVLDQLAGAAADLPFAAGDYRVAVVSIDPRETPAQAAQLARRLRERHGQIVSSWQLLTGGAAAVDTLADAVGFQYAYDAERDSYAHPAGLVVVATGGLVSRYLLRIERGQPDLRLALVDAGRGKLGSPVDQLLLRCYHFDPDTGRYSVAVMRLLQFGGGLSLFALGGLVIGLRRSERWRERP